MDGLLESTRRDLGTIAGACNCAHDVPVTALQMPSPAWRWTLVLDVHW